MSGKSYMQLADEILEGALTDPGKVVPNSLVENQEELPELTDAAHAALMAHTLDEGVIGDTVSKIKQKAVVAGHRAKAYVTGKVGPYSWKNKAKRVKHGLTFGGGRERTLRGDLKKVRKKLKPKSRAEKNKEQASMGVVPRDYTPEGGGGAEGAKRLKKHLKLDHMENLNQDQIEILRKAKEIVSEMTTVGALGVTHGRSSGGHHPALQVKLPGDKDQAAQIKAASTPPVFKAKAAKDPAPSGKKKTRVIVKRKTPQSKDDETQRRVHDDMKAMYHESFDAFVDGVLLNEDYTGKGYKGDVSVADFGRKGPANDTFGGGGVRSKGRGPVVKLTKNQLMTAKKKGKGSDKDHETPGFGNASKHSRKHPQNPYAGSK